MTEPNAAAELATDLGMLRPDDVQVCISELLGLDLHYDEIPAELAAEVRDMLDPHGERSAPAGLYWPGHERPKGSPTGEEGFYDEENE